LQFLIEAIILSVMGGIIGIFLGWAGSKVIGGLFGTAAAISLTSVLVAFTFSALIGIVFGVFPPKKPLPSTRLNRCAMNNVIFIKYGNRYRRGAEK
jgi:hypothetical protein